MRVRLQLSLLVLAETAALVIVATRVHSPDPVDWGDLAGWVGRAGPEAVVLAAARLVALAATAWLLGGTLLALGARVVAAGTGWDRLARHGARFAPGAVRRLLEAAVAVGVVAGALAPVPAFAAVSAPVVVAPLGPVRDGRAAPGVAAPVAVTPVTSPREPVTPGSVTPATAAPVSVSVPDATRPDATRAGTTHVVEAGENLWTIAADHLRAVNGVTPDLASTIGYWRAVCDVNRAQLRSGDVGLLHPGETVTLPPA